MAYITQVDPAAFDWGRAAAEGREIGKTNKLRDLARGYDFSQAGSTDKFRQEAYKIDPLQTERDYGTLLSGFDERQRQQAAALKDAAGKRYLQIRQAPREQQATMLAAAAADPQLGAVFKGATPDNLQMIEAELLSFDDALKQLNAREKNQQIRTTLGLGAPGQPQQPAPQPAGGYRTTLARYESGGNDAAAASGSSAVGRYQPIAATWDRYAPGKDRTDPQAQEEFLTAFLADNAKTFQAKNGRLPNDAEQYAMHWFGPQNADRLFKLPDTAPIESVIGGGAAVTNGLDGKTVGEVKALLAQRMGAGMTWQDGADSGQSVQTASNDGSAAAVFQSLPQWQQAAILSADDPMAEFAKVAGDAGKPPQTRTRPIGDQEITEEFKNGKWVEVSRAPRWKQESAVPGPFGSTALDAQAYNIVSAYQGKKAAGQPTTPQEDFDYQLAVRQLQQPKVVLGPDGNQYLVNPEPIPQFGAQPGASPPQPASVQPVGTGANKDVREIEATTARVQQSVGRYRDALNTYGEGPTKKIFAPGEASMLESAYNDLMLEAKELYRLGVLNGPDYTIMTQTLTPPTSIGAAFINKETMLKQVDELEGKLNSALRAVKNINAPQGGGAAAPADNDPLDIRSK